MRRRTAALLTAALALAAPGCGGDDEQQPTGKDALRETVERFFISAAQGDGREACELTDQAFQETVGADCPKGLTGIYAGEVPDVRAITIKGDRATARLSSAPPDDTIELVRQNGEWRVALSGE